MDAPRIIARIRDGHSASAEELGWFACGLANGSVSDAQAGAFAMAVLLRGLGEEGRVALTRAMAGSGRILGWDVPGPVADKHSTGGIGDCVSLLLAPAMAVCGAYVPMISGRGLGYLGGTLDKLQSIPGLRVDLSEAELRAQVGQIGCAIVAASADLAPADRRLYAVRDVTSTVESIDLITASILSKKLAAGLQALVLDVKCGSGAFMKTRAEADALAQALVQAAQGAGCRTTALVTDMDQPLVPAAGNALEVAEVMRTFADPSANPRLVELTSALGGEALVLAGLATDRAAGQEMILKALHSGAAAKRFGQMIHAQSGPPDFLTNWHQLLPVAPVQLPVPAQHEGFVTAIDGAALGQAVVRLGGGRLQADDKIAPGVGLSELAPLGAARAKGEPLAMVHAMSEEAARQAVEAVTMAYELGDTAPMEQALVYQSIG